MNSNIVLTFGVYALLFRFAQILIRNFDSLISRWRQLIRISPYQFRLISPDPLLKASIGWNITTSLVYSLSRYMYRWRLFCVLLRNYGSSLTLHSMINGFTCYNCSLIRGSGGGDGLSRLASTSLKNFRITK